VNAIWARAQGTGSTTIGVSALSVAVTSLILQLGTSTTAQVHTLPI
jgi:hypothetical protein